MGLGSDLGSILGSILAPRWMPTSSQDGLSLGYLKEHVAHTQVSQKVSEPPGLSCCLASLDTSNGQHIEPKSASTRFSDLSEVMLHVASNVGADFIGLGRQLGP